MKTHLQLSLRAIWLIAGICALAAGVIGIVLPLVPTTPFLLIAAYAFARSSPRLNRWLLNHRHFGPAIENWRRYGAINRRAKTLALAMIAATPLVTLLFGVPLWALLTQIGVLALVATFIVTRPSGAPVEHRVSSP